MADSNVVEAVVETKAAALAQNDVIIDRIRAAFEVQNSTALIYTGNLRKQNLYHVTRMVAANPHCLQNHVRRIFLAILCKDRGAAIGGLIDLHLVLKGRGHFLFERLVKKVLQLLGGNLSNTLEKTLLGNDVQRLMSLPLEHSVLANGKSGSLFQV